jgi:hypothetical protein
VATSAYTMAENIVEHVNTHGQLVVPVANSLDPSPKRPGWRPWWVNINLKRDPQKLVYYKPEEEETS